MIVTFVLAVVKDEHVCHRTPKRAGPEITRLGDAQQQHLAALVIDDGEQGFEPHSQSPQFGGAPVVEAGVLHLQPCEEKRRSCDRLDGDAEFRCGEPEALQGSAAIEERVIVARGHRQQANT